jgi:hypothetical protein
LQKCVPGSFTDVRSNFPRWWHRTAFSWGESSLVSQSADIEVHRTDFGIGAETACNFHLKRVDEEGTEPVFVNFAVCLLLVSGHVLSEQAS